MLGRSPAYARAAAQIERAASCSLPVLLGGETGTGKTTAAEAIAGGAESLVVARSLPESLIEAELFGHERGAFTGASKLKMGLVEQANGRTLLLEEVGDLPPKAQVALLGVLEDGKFRRLGGEKDIQVSVRVVAATWKDLGALVREGTFREDLYYRLNVVSITMPPLRERGEDVVLLAEAQLGREVTEVERAALLAHHWPGNIRELRNVTDRMSVGIPVCEAIGAALPAPGQPAPGQPAPGQVDSDLSVLFSAVRARGVQKVAEMIAMPRGTLAKKLNGQRPTTWCEAKKIAAAVGLEIRIG
ncbi:MAG: AAA domain-containing protein [Gammaproteobacteria bacterium]|nr:AAA domain-containing protein [Gammaproteobacteria bacterium]